MIFVENTLDAILIPRLKTGATAWLEQFLECYAQDCEMTYVGTTAQTIAKLLESRWLKQGCDLGNFFRAFDLDQDTYYPSEYLSTRNGLSGVTMPSETRLHSAGSEGLVDTMYQSQDKYAAALRNWKSDGGPAETVRTNAQRPLRTRGPRHRQGPCTHRSPPPWKPGRPGDLPIPPRSPVPAPNE